MNSAIIKYKCVCKNCRLLFSGSMFLIFKSIQGTAHVGLTPIFIALFLQSSQDKRKLFINLLWDQQRAADSHRVSKSYCDHYCGYTLIYFHISRL